MFLNLAPAVTAEQLLHRLHADLARLGGLAETQVADAVRVVATRDVALGHAVVARDARLDDLQRQIERQSAELLMRGQPLALDVRRAVGAIKLAMGLERTGDLARNIARRGVALAAYELLPAPTRSLQRMGALVAARTRDVLDAYLARDLDRAMGVWSRDEEVDEHHNSLVRELLAAMSADPAAVAPGAHMLMVSKTLERIGDHATGVAELLHYEITGEDPATPRPMGVYAL